MKKREIFMLSVLTFFMGMVLGFIISPAKNGFGNNTWNTINNNYDKKHIEAEEAE